jgi:hypothetical protein
VDAERAVTQGERDRIATEITNLTTAIAHGGDIPALAAALAERDKRLKKLDAILAKPVALPPDREVLCAALRLREGEWRDVLRGPHIAQARVVLQHLMNLPIKVLNQPVPSYITRGDTRGTEGIKWGAETRPGDVGRAGTCGNVPNPFEPDRWAATAGGVRESNLGISLS